MDEKLMLVGWDDGKIYFYLRDREGCVSDEPELFEQVIALCQQYYERKWQEEERLGKIGSDSQSTNLPVSQSTNFPMYQSTVMRRRL